MNIQQITIAVLVSISTFAAGYWLGKEPPVPAEPYRSKKSSVGVVFKGDAAKVREALLNTDKLVRTAELSALLRDLGPDSIDEVRQAFDTVFSMGVLYHRKDPVHHLKRIRSLLRAGGTMVLETLVLPPGSEQGLLIPKDRYARMRNVWAVPGTGQLESWAGEAGFDDYKLVNRTKTGIEEQRSTDWMRFESLEKALDPLDPGKTVEGHPAPERVVVIARNP